MILELGGQDFTRNQETNHHLQSFEVFAALLISLEISGKLPAVNGLPHRSNAELLKHIIRIRTRIKVFALLACSQSFDGQRIGNLNFKCQLCRIQAFPVVS